MELGFEAEPFGDGDVALKAYPSVVTEGEAWELFVAVTTALEAEAQPTRKQPALRRYRQLPVFKKGIAIRQIRYIFAGGSIAPGVPLGSGLYSLLVQRSSRTLPPGDHFRSAVIGHCALPTGSSGTL